MLIEEGFKKIFESSDFNESHICTIMDPSYIQHVDGKTLNFKEFIEHLKSLKERTKSIDVNFKNLIEEGETAFSNHVITATMKDDTKTVIHVIAEFRFKKGKMYYCDELTMLINGDPDNGDLGSTL